ncbi:MAG: DUF885 domain-containing protein [Caulobacterales bacterium]
MNFSRRSLLAAGAAASVLAACQPKAASGPSKESQALASALDELATAVLKEAPEFATALAVDEKQAGGPFQDRLSDLSTDGQKRRAQLVVDSLARLKAIDRAGLSPADAVSLDVATGALGFYEAGAKFGYGRYGFGEPLPYVVTQIDGAFVNIPDFLDSQHPVTSKPLADAYLARLEGFAAMLDQETARIKDDAGKGVVPPDFILDGALKQLKAFGAKKPADTVLVASLAGRVKSLTDVDAAGQAALVKSAEAIVKDKVLPAYARQIEALAALRPKAVHDAGVWRLPQGAEFYAAGLAAQTTTTMTADEIHQMGLDLVASLTSEMDALLKGQGLTKGTVAARIQALSTRPDQLYSNTDKGREQLLADLNTQIDAVTARMPEQFGALAKAKLAIKRVPEYIQAGAPGGYYQPAALDGSRPGAYYINLRDTAEWPKFTLPTLSYHEGMPGHHWQIAIAQESQGLPFIRRAILGFNAYAEGWGLYAEQLADEIGLYEGNPFGRLGYLQSATFRATRLVVDTGIHAKQWSREKAIDFMVGATGDQRSSVVTEIERYAAWPGQACGYMVGRQVINRLRSDAKTKLAAKYDQKAFHDVVLTNGSVPLSVLESLVGAYVAKTGAA